MARVLRAVAGTGYNTNELVKVAVGASQTIEVGDLLQITSNKAVVAAAASTTICGIATEAITTGGSPTSTDAILVQPVKGKVIRIAYTGSTKTSLADTDLYTTKFDLSDKKTVNLDDTTGGMCSVVAYNNTDDTADVIIANANIVDIG